MAAADWATVAVPGAFVVGAVVGSVIVLRLGRIILTYLRGDDHSD